MELLNINVGILGHVDSGKTSLVKALSTVLSTASLDKNPQSRARGITLDLGFSAFTVAVPEHLPQEKYSNLQFTLVDCPGHASLIRTIIGGAQIMDMMLVVVDSTKGMQAQTMECVVIGEAVMARGADVIVVLNKVDLIPEEERAERLRQVEKDITAQLAGTKLSSASFVHCAAAVGGEKTAASSTKLAWGNKGRGGKGGGRSTNEKGTAGGPGNHLGTDVGHSAAPPQGKSDQTSGTQGVDAQEMMSDTSTMGVDAVAAELTRRARVPGRRASAPLYFAFDHCFSVRGQGTILTGTVLTGELKVNQLVELPALRLQKRVKSMQMYRKPVTVARAGDRVGVCLASLDAKLLERGVVATPDSVRPILAAIAIVRKVPAFSGQCRSGAYCHVSLGHTTAMATATFFGAMELQNEPQVLFGDVRGNEVMASTDGGDNGPSLEDMASWPFPWQAEFAQQPAILGRVNLDGQDAIADNEEFAQDKAGCLQYCHLAFHTPVITPANSVVLGSRLDTSGPANSFDSVEGRGALTTSGAGDSHCRIAFHGRLVAATIGGTRKAQGDAGVGLEFGTESGQLKIFTEKLKAGVVFRVGAGNKTTGLKGGVVEAFGKDLFKKETNMSPFVGMILLTEDGSAGHIESAFGKAGRFKAHFPPGTSVKVGDKLILKFRKFVGDRSKRMNQRYLRESLQRSQSLKGNANECNAPRGSDDSSVAITYAEEPVGEEEQESHQRDGVVDSVKYSEDGNDGPCVAIVSGLFSQEEDIRALAKLGIAIQTTSSAIGYLRGPFGKLGKCKVEFARGGSMRPGDHVFVPR